MKVKMFVSKITEIEIKFSKNEEFCGNAVTEINSLLENGYTLKEAVHNSMEISSTMIFVKKESDSR